MSQLPASLTNYLHLYAARRWRVGLLRAGGVALGLFLFWMIAWCIVDRLLPLATLIEALSWTTLCPIAWSRRISAR